VDKFEKVNDESVNIIGLDDTTEDGNVKNKPTLYPIRVSLYKSTKNVVHNLLLYGDRKGNNHYVPIIDMSRLISHTNTDGHRRLICHHCLQSWSVRSEHKYKEHMDMGCYNHEACRTVFPSKDKSTLKFKNYRHMEKAPYTAYADFEAFTVINSGKKPNPDNSYTMKYQTHKPSGYVFVVVDDEGNMKHFEMFEGNDINECINDFVKKLTKIGAEIKKELTQNIPMKLTERDYKDFENATHCYICEEAFEEGEMKCRDHDHRTGEYRGATHPGCNLNYNLKNFKLPVFIHNLKGYDSHLMLGELSNPESYNIECIPLNSEKYMTFSINQVQFKDSCNFLNDSLDKLAKNMKPEDFKLTNAYFKEQASLMIKKGVFPYDWWNCEEKMAYTSLPSKECFYSTLNDEDISDADYLRAKLVWKTFNCKTMKDYHDIYLKCDGLILADIFEKFRETSIQSYRIDPAYYISLPSYAWDCMLLSTKTKLELFTDPNMYLFVENGIRGGISMITHRHMKANNKYLGDNYDKKLPSWFISYLDANNLYGWAMSQALPHGNFEWSDSGNFNTERIMNMTEDQDKGYIFQVDLEYPKELHDKHNDYPLAVESLCVDETELSPYQNALKEKVPSSVGKVRKLIGTLKDKKNYVIHYRNLQLYLSLGLKLKRITKALSFSQSHWLKKYIQMNTDMRSKATTDFEKDLYKLMNNVVFGKTMENVRNRINYRLIYNDDEKVGKLVSRYNFHDITTFNYNLTGVHMRKTSVNLNKPIYVGFCILDLSKHLMYDFHYNFMLKKYGHKRVKLLFTDADSLCYGIQTDDFYADMRESKELFDMSDYPKYHTCYDHTNKKVIGKFKDETSGNPVVEFVGLKAKMYSLNIMEYKLNETCNEWNSEVEVGSGEKKVAKGIKKSVIKKGLFFEGYKNVLFGKDGKYHTREVMKTIRSEKHQLSTVEINKIGLCAFDDKRYILDDGFTTLAYGNKAIPV